MGVSKVTLNGATLMDVTDKTVDTDNLLDGETALRNDGESISGAVVTAAASDTAPAMDGTASAGSATTYSRGDHVHPSDTSKQAVITATGILKGNGAGSVTAATIDDTPTNNSNNLVTSGGVFSAIPTKTSDLTNDSSFITASGAPVQSVNSKTGAVVLTASDVGALPDDTTIPQGTVTSVRVQATNPVQSSTSTAQSATLNTTISLANGYGDTQNPYASKTKNTVLAAPSAANGTPSFRALVADDIPSLTISKISDFPEIPSKTSDLTNDSNFVSDASYMHTDNNFTTTLKNRLEGIAAGAEVNQNAFSNVKVGNSTITADTKTDTLTLTAGGNITLTPDTTNDAVTIAATVPTKVSELTNDSSYITAAGAPVQSVNSKTGAVTLTASDVGALPDSTTIPQGTVTSVRVQATSPVQSSTSTAQSATLNTTISLANGYGDTKNPYAAKNANVVLAGPSTGEASVPSFRALVADDIPSLTKSKISDFPESMPPDAHTHGDITNGGDIATNATIASGDRLVINDESASKITNSSITFGTSTTTFLSNKGTWATPTGAVTSVNSKSGAVTLEASDVGALPDDTDVTKWNGITLSKTVSDLSNQEAIVPFLWSSSETTARYATVSKVPSYNCIAQYSNGYLNSTTPSASDNSTKVATTAYVDSAISNLGSILNYKGTKATESALPSTGNVTGDVWIVSADNSEYVWNGTAWEKLGPTIDLSGYVPTSRTVNGKALSTDISLSASDVSALPDSTDVTKWNGVTLSKSTMTGSTSNYWVACVSGTGSITADYLTVTHTPTAYKIAKYDGSSYLHSTTPSASDNSTKVATTAYVKTAVGSISAPVTSVNSKTGAVVLTAADVGALPTTTSIPSATSDLTNDSGFITSADIPAYTFNNGVSVATNGVDIYNSGVVSVGASPSTAANGTIAVTTGTGKTTSSTSYIAVKGLGTAAYTASTAYAAASHEQALSTITGADNLKAIEALTGTSGFLKKTAANTWSLDTASYVPTTRTVNGKALSSNISLSASDVGALPDTTSIPTATSDLTNDSGYITISDVPEAPVLSVNGSTGTVELTATDVGAQEEITATGILKGDGSGGITAAVSGTDYIASLTSGTGISVSGATINHSNSVTAATAGTSSATSGSSLAVPYITYDAQGHITGSGTHTHTVSGFAASTHAHGDITSAGDITTTATIASGDRIVINDESASKVTNSSITFGTATTTFLANNGTWQTPAKGSTATTRTASLAVASWNTSTKQITVTVSGVTASNLVEVSPAPASWSVASAAGVYCSAQAANSLTFKCSSIPTAAITVNVVIWG